MKENFVQLWVIYFKSWWKKTLYNSELFTFNLDERKLCTTLSYLLWILMKENFVQLWVIYFESSPFHLASYLFSVQNPFKTVVIFAGPNYQTVKWY